MSVFYFMVAVFLFAFACMGFWLIVEDVKAENKYYKEVEKWM